MAEPPDTLHLLKAGRILQYRQQNVAMVSADEGAEFEIVYASRWIAPGTTATVGDPALVILSDSPYERVDPVRYATVTDAEHDRNGLRVRIRVGPFPVVEDLAALESPSRPHPTKPPWFVWRQPTDGMRPPRSDHEAREAWRAAVDRLRGNQFYEDSRFARLTAVLDGHGHEVRERSLALDDSATAVIELRSTGGADAMHSVLVESDPPGTIAGGVNDERPDPEGHLNVPIRALTGGTHTVDLSFTPEPLLSTRLRFELTAHKHVPPPPPPTSEPLTEVPVSGPPVSEADPALVQALVERLRRVPALAPNDLFTLLEDNVLPLAPTDPVVRSMTAEAAFAVTEYRVVVELLDDPGAFRAGDAFRRLMAGLHLSVPTDVAALLRQIDLGTEQNVTLLRANLPELPTGAIRQVAEVILDELAGKEVLDRLLPPVFEQLQDDLALRVAAECAAADPDAWLERVLDRWPRPHRMPAAVLDEILTWNLTTHALAPYVHEAIDRHLEAGEVTEVLELDERARALLPRVDQVRLRTSTARLLLDDDPAMARRLLLEAARESAGLGDPDLATELAFTLRERWPDGDDPEVDDAVERLRSVLDDLTDFQEWRDKRDADAADELRPHTNGKVLHIVGGRRQPWADSLADELGLKDLRWHESERGRPPMLDWADGLDPDREIVVLIWNHCGHSTTHGLDTRGVRYRPAVWGRTSVLGALGVDRD